VIATAARGSMRDALSITDQAIAFGRGALAEADVTDMLGLVGRDEVGGLVDALASADAHRVLAVTAELAERAVDFQELLSELLSVLHAMAVRHALDDGAEACPFDAETVQLYYQIALMGFRDLQIAPDPRSGVEMTLLRMLAFAPAADGAAGPPGGRPVPRAQAPTGNAPPPPEPSAPPSQPSSSHPTTSQAGSAQASNPAPAETSQAASAQASWYELLARLPLGGVARMIAEHSELVSLTDAAIELRLDQTHDTLLGDSQVEQIRRALVETLGHDVGLEIVPGRVSSETPAARNARLAEERQRDAELALAADATVRSLITEFGGQLDAVRAVDERGG
jgi:DNA polymerase-3 subunit gamma/tau